MKKEVKQKFGGGWTEEKLERVRKYLVAYATIMKKQNFKFAYIDAFAGTGFREKKKAGELVTPQTFFDDDLSIEEGEAFIDGSARIALRVEPDFDKYIFVEKSEGKAQSLELLKQEFPDKADKIQIVCDDSNVFLEKLCRMNWSNRRAVLFLDPFGMQVRWDTLKAIADTKAIDLWILFPLGAGVSRLLRKDGKIDSTMKTKLDTMFGEASWYDAFYKEASQTSLFEDSASIEKVADFDAIAAYFVSRLKTIFPHVHPQPLELYNSKNVPLFLLCFAAGNTKGGSIAVKIAGDILKRGK